jgi:hypothetical protein
MEPDYDREYEEYLGPDCAESCTCEYCVESCVSHGLCPSCNGRLERDFDEELHYWCPKCGQEYTAPSPRCGAVAYHTETPF